MKLTDEQWEVLLPILQPLLSAPGTGRPATPLRPVLDGILWKVRCRAAWHDIPAEYPCYVTCFRYHRQLVRLGLLKPLYQALLDDLQARGGMEPYAAFQRGDLFLQTCRRRHYVVINPAVPVTWQLFTAQLFVCLALDVIARASAFPGKGLWELVAEPLQPNLMAPD